MPHESTSDLLLGIHPDAVLTLGDDQYQRGNLAAFIESYDRTWGRLESDYPPYGRESQVFDSRCSGRYFAYFCDAAGPSGKGYYSFDLGAGT